MIGTEMTRPHMLWLLAALALYLVVYPVAQAVIPSSGPPSGAVFPQVCRVVMAEDLDR